MCGFGKVEVDCCLLFGLRKTVGVRLWKKNYRQNFFDESLRLRLVQLNTLPDVEFSQEQSTILRAIAKVLKLSVAHLNVYFEQEQAHDFMK
ncbi:hypothetical protein BSPWISOXPB_8868 [uncultured Gammaproteobacteria bacterium]|nr:hypothetical protein BSPWISOXPB_8868 [uncultured Gammaproteobacteria bacterium]